MDKNKEGEMSALLSPNENGYLYDSYERYRNHKTKYLYRVSDQTVKEVIMNGHANEKLDKRYALVFRW